MGYPEEVTLPTAWLARQDRDQLERTAAGLIDADWIAEELNLLGDHDGPFELEFHVN